MPSSYTTHLGLEKQADGENDGTWGTKVNTVFDQLDEAIAGITSVTITATGHTLTLTDGGSAEDGRHHTLDIGGTPTALPTMIVPNIEKTWLIRNDSGRGLEIRTATGSAYSMTSGVDELIQCDGANVIRRALNDVEFNSIVGFGTSDSPQFAGLGIGRAATADLDVLITDTVNPFLIESTDASASVIDGVRLYRNSASPVAGDEMFAVLFSGEDSGGAVHNYARIVGLIGDPTAGAEYGRMDLRVATNGGDANASALRIWPRSTTEIQLLAGQPGSLTYPAFSFNDNTGSGLYYVSPDMRLAVDGVFSVSFTDDSAGIGNRVLIGKTTEGSVTTFGWDFPATPATQSTAYGTSDQASVLDLNRHSNDGVIMNFENNGAIEGTISISGTTVSYNGAHLSRFSQFQANAKPSIYRGTVIEGIDEMCEWWLESWTDTKLTKRDSATGQMKKVPRNMNSSMHLSKGHREGDTYTDEDGFVRTVSKKKNEQLTRSKISDTPGSSTITGVFDMWIADRDEDKGYNDFILAQSGDFVIRVKSGFTGVIGDLLESAGDGTAKVQADSTVKSSTIAKVLGTTPIEVYPDGTYTIPCLLMMG